MSAAHHARVKRLFLAARDLPPTDREQFIAESCSEDDDLRREVLSLLLRHDEEPEINDSTATAAAPTPPFAPVEKPVSIANFRLLQKIGEGGMGVVWEAEQQHPVRRRVALKVLKGGLSSKEAIARFESERQALAMMSHPNIAKVFEAGATDEQQPYLAMELVRGEPITEFCDRHRLTTSRRLELFVEVCAGVQHAHQKGVIHRDLKPSNVLVAFEDGRAEPKIIDFGVAKTTAQRLTEHTLFTERGQWVGTPEYMSPEQAEMSGLDIDTRSDVYSLGVLLYELLAGARPFDSKELRQADLDEIRRRIREDEPTRPSTKVSGLGDESEMAARNRQVDPATLVQQLRGDLDWITLKALEKDRTRRYAAPSELAADIRRHLSYEPVLACPPTTVYRLKRFVRRHRVGVLAGGVVVAAILLGLAMAGLALGKARAEAERANQVASFLEELLDVFNPYENLSAASSQKMLDRAVERLESELAGQELAQARLMLQLGRAYRFLDLFEQSEPLLQRARQILQSEFGPEHPEVAAILAELGGLAYEAGHYSRARRYHEESLRIQSRVLSADAPGIAEIETELGFMSWNLGDFARAEELLTSSLASLESTYGPEHLAVTQNLFFQGVLFNNSGDYRRARIALERALRIRRAILGPEHPRVGWTARTLARAQLLQGDYQLALTTSMEALDVMKESLGSESSDIAFALETVGTVHRLQGDFAEARPLLERSLALRESTLGPDHVEIGLSLNKLGWLYLDFDDPDAAAPLIERALAIDLRSRGPSHPRVAWSLHALSRQRRLSGQLEEAMAMQRQALQILETTNAPDQPVLADHLSNLGSLLREGGDLDAARPLLERALQLHQQQLGTQHRLIADDLRELAILHHLAGENDRAGQSFDRALAMYEATVGDEHPAAGRCLRAWARHLGRAGRVAEAAVADSRAAAIEARIY